MDGCQRRRDRIGDGNFYFGLVNHDCAVLLSGGSGTRLWLKSRQSYPKKFVGASTPFQPCAHRLSGRGYAPPVVATNADYRFIVTGQLSGIAIVPETVLIEPEGRNTAPAVLAAALWVAKTDPEALMLVSPSDHVVPDFEAFRSAVETGVPAACNGQLVTFGITPTHA